MLFGAMSFGAMLFGAMLFGGDVVRGHIVRGNLVRGDVVRGNVFRGHVWSEVRDNFSKLFWMVLIWALFISFQSCSNSASLKIEVDSILLNSMVLKSSFSVWF